MRLKRPYVASVDQVRISREADEAVIEYVEPGFWTTHFRHGPSIGSTRAGLPTTTS